MNPVEIWKKIEKKKKMSITVTITAPFSCCTTRSGVDSSSIIELFCTEVNKFSSTVAVALAVQGNDNVDFSAEMTGATGIISVSREAPSVVTSLLTTVRGLLLLLFDCALSTETSTDSSGTLMANIFRCFVLP